MKLWWLLLVNTAIAAEPQDIVFTSKVDGTPQRYVLLLPNDFDPEKPHSLLIALHGHGADRWQFVKEARDECRAARDCAARHGLIYISPDYRAKTSWMGPKAEADLLQILDELGASHRLHRVILCGGSMGGTSALIFAALHPQRIHGVVSFNGTANITEFTGFDTAIAESYGGTRAEVPEEYRKRTAELMAESLTMPLAMTTGGKDRVVPADSVLRLVEKLNTWQSPVKLLHRPDGGHSTNYADAISALEFVMQKLHPD